MEYGYKSKYGHISMEYGVGLRWFYSTEMFFLGEYGHKPIFIL